MTDAAATTFRDRQGREYTLRVDVAAARKIRRRLQVDILDIDEGLSRLGRDVVLLVDVLYVLCEEQCAAHGIDDEQFGADHDGHTLEAASAALVEALLDFFPPRKANLLRQMQELNRELETTCLKIGTEKIPQAILQLRKLNASPPGDSSDGTPQCSDSTPAPTASVNSAA